MGLLDGLPVWAMALAIFGLRVCDVSLGTLRTISVVQGKLPLAVTLGFFEVLIWICGVSSVMTGIREHPHLALAFAGGFAAGNGVGILLERFIALGSVALTLISPGAGPAIAQELRARGQRLTTFAGEGRDGPVTMIYTTCPRRRVRWVLETARRLDSHLFYTVEPLREWRLDRSLASPQPNATLFGSLTRIK